MSKQSYVEVAYEVLTEVYDSAPTVNGKKENYALAFGELAGLVCERMGITNQDDMLKIASKFYTALTLDGRFVLREDNTWVLREHELFDTVHIDMNSVYSEDDDDKENEDEDIDENSDRNEDSDDYDENEDENNDEAPVISGDDEEEDD